MHDEFTFLRKLVLLPDPEESQENLYSFKTVSIYDFLDLLSSGLDVLSVLIEIYLY